MFLTIQSNLCWRPFFSHWPATFLAQANSLYTHSCFNTFHISHLFRTVKPTKVGVKRCHDGDGNHSLRNRRNQTCCKSVCEPGPKSLFWAFSSAVYQDLSKRHDWPVKKAIVVLPIRSNGNQNALPVIRWVRRGPRTRPSPLFADLTNRGYVCETGYKNEDVVDGHDGFESSFDYRTK